MNMPPRPTHMHLNQDAMALRQPPASPDAHQGKMLAQQMQQDIVAHAEDRVPGQIVAMAEDMRGERMNFDTAQQHANSLALAVKSNVLQEMGMKGVPLDGLANVRTVAAQMGIA